MFLKNRNTIFQMKISKVTDYAALTAQKKGKTELKSLCIVRRLMLIDICFMKIS